MDFGEMQTPFQKLSKMERGGNHQLGKGEMSRMRLEDFDEATREYNADANGQNERRIGF